MTRGRAAEAAAATALLLVVALQVHTLDDSDTWWHLASGRLIAAERAVARADPFSFTAPGAPWINRQWLFDLAAYGTWRAGGPAGPILLAAALFTAAFATLYALARRRLPAWGAAALVVLAAQAAVERFTVRPEAATFLLLATYLLVLDRATLGLRALVALVVLQAVWANLHALSVLGLVVLGAELVSAAAARWLPLPPGWRHASRRDGRAVAGLAAATAGAIAAEAATPFGLAGALFPLRLLGVLRGAEVTSAPIIEHRAPALAELSPPVALGLVALLALAALAALVSWRRWRIAHLLIAAAFTALALLARRNVALIGPGVLPLVASGLAPVAAAADRRLARRPRAGAALGAALALGFALATVLVVSGDYYRASRLTRTFGLGVSGLLFPAGAVDFLDAAAPSARLFNDDVLGGYLLWRDYPRRRVFIDGRFHTRRSSMSRGPSRRSPPATGSTLRSSTTPAPDDWSWRAPSPRSRAGGSPISTAGPSSSSPTTGHPSCPPASSGHPWHGPPRARRRRWRTTSAAARCSSSLDGRPPRSRERTSRPRCASFRASMRPA